MANKFSYEFTEVPDLESAVGKHIVLGDMAGNLHRLDYSMLADAMLFNLEDMHNRDIIEVIPNYDICDGLAPEPLDTQTNGAGIIRLTMKNVKIDNNTANMICSVRPNLPEPPAGWLWGHCVPVFNVFGSEKFPQGLELRVWGIAPSNWNLMIGNNSGADIFITDDDKLEILYHTRFKLIKE